jgi:hypothetical protein
VAKQVNPLLPCLQRRFGEHPDFAAAAQLLKEKTGRTAVPDSLRLIAHGHRRPSGDLALDIETTFGVTARELLEWAHYARQAKRAA